jgi:hypothetical protein
MSRAFDEANNGGGDHSPMNTHDDNPVGWRTEPHSRRSLGFAQQGMEQASFRGGEPRSRAVAPMSAEALSRRGLGGMTAEQGSRVYAGKVLVGEVLSKNYDLSAVESEDTSSVLATIHCIVTLEDRVPDLGITVNREPGYYAIVVRGFDEFIDIVNWHGKVRMTSGTGGHNKMRLVHNFLANPGTGVLIVRVGMRETGAAGAGLPMLPGLEPVVASLGTVTGKRSRSPERETETGPAVDFELARRILESLRGHCNMDEVEAGDDVHRLLTVLYHVTMLDSDLPLLEVSPVRRDDSGAYVMTCRGFIHVLDFDQIYDRIVRRASTDDALRTVQSVAYNPVQGVLELCVTGSRAGGPGKRRRAGSIVL